MHTSVGWSRDGDEDGGGGLCSVVGAIEMANKWNFCDASFMAKRQRRSGWPPKPPSMCVKICKKVEGRVKN